MTGKTYQRKWPVCRVCPGLGDVMLNPGRKRNWEHGWGWGWGRQQEKNKEETDFQRAASRPQVLSQPLLVLGWTLGDTEACSGLQTPGLLLLPPMWWIPALGCTALVGNGR